MEDAKKIRVKNGYTRYIAKDKGTTDTICVWRYGCDMHTEDGKLTSKACPSVCKLISKLNGNFELQTAYSHEGIETTRKRGIAPEIKEVTKKYIECGAKRNKILRMFENENIPANRMPDIKMLSNLRKANISKEKKEFVLKTTKAY